MWRSRRPHDGMVERRSFFGVQTFKTPFWTIDGTLEMFAMQRDDPKVLCMGSWYRLWGVDSPKSDKSSLTTLTA